MSRPNLVVLSGAGISAESGIPTFRDAKGLWERYDIMEVASPQGWATNPRQVLDFYNQRRKVAERAIPNEGHKILVELEQWFNVSIVTQNVDDLHERAGSSKVIHLHGELFKSRSTVDGQLIYPIESSELNMGDLCEKGSQLRPHIVWFGEDVPLMENAIALTNMAEIFVVVGTSLAVYPAAGLLNVVNSNVPKYIVDPNMPQIDDLPNLFLVAQKGSTGLTTVKEALAKSYAL